ncbi:DUF4304 domain-containing protein [Microbacterium sp. PMB16]|uniref:DUF4304 domain-containing protein n=1 Tax=Microbacterium sp. PMB16 TaxID=3120157 RepID=UPI003F4C392E
MDKQTTTALLRTHFYPVLKDQGFVRSGNVLRRFADPVVHVVEVVHQPRRGAFRVDLGVHLTLLGDVSRHVIDPTKIREPDCAWRSSIIPGFRNDHDPDFAYGTTASDAEESVSFLVSEWDRQSTAFFGRLTTWPGDFLDAARAAIETPPHPAHLLTWSRAAALAGDFELARRCAEVALPSVPERATALRADIEAILRGPQTAMPQLR